MNQSYKEIAFENAIEHYLTRDGGYDKGNNETYSRELALDPSLLIPFIKKTQPKAWAPIEKYHGADTEKAVISDLVYALDNMGSLHVIRHGFKCFGKTLRIAYFSPSHGMNPEAAAFYNENKLIILRQLHYSTKNENSIDVVLLLNGLPFATLELKNPYTGQNVNNAIEQYKKDRSPSDPIFAFRKRTLVHFAVDPALVYMATAIEKDDTQFLPFNQGYQYGQGNPPAEEDKYRTSYLWEEVLSKDSILDILARFIHLEQKEKKILTEKGIITRVKESMIFPRYHQLTAVRKLIDDTAKSGHGKNYLIQHSAGSGKSNTIAWLAHRLSNLHNTEDKKIFSSVIVITDRLVLDKQLQDTIYQFEHKQGVVQKIDKDSTQLAEALNKSVPVIITTIQKFPFIAEKVDLLKDKTFAVIVDEAHSSQSGETAADLKGILNRDGIMTAAKEQAEDEDLDDLEEKIIREMAKRGKQENLSFYAFTATPKYKTLKIFDVPGENGNPPFHLYSMRQAIEEGFIMDVLAHYTTYKNYYGIIKYTEDDPDIEKKKGAKRLARFLRLHPHSIAQKVEVIVEHFRTSTMHKIGGRAKAMIVTDSRLQAVRYKLAIDKYIKDNNYNGIKTLVAFSGKVEDPDKPGSSYTETGMNNGIKEKELPEKFESDEYKILLVAEKYQTGFDQPLLHTMYVDKKLSGIQAVQTLSRLNRIATGKEDTFVLDFVNDTKDIYEAFKPYYERTETEGEIDPRRLYALQNKLDEFHVYYKSEVDKLCSIYFNSSFTDTEKNHARLYAVVDPAVERFKVIEKEEDKEDFKHTLVAFRNLYSFLSQIIPYGDTELEKLYIYIRFLHLRLPKGNTNPLGPIEKDVKLKYYRLSKISEGSIKLNDDEERKIHGSENAGGGSGKDEEVKLSALVEVLNERFGTDFTEADQIFFEQFAKKAEEREDLRQAAKANEKDDFRYVFVKIFDSILVDQMDDNEDIYNRIMGNPDFKETVIKHLIDNVYDKLKKTA